VRRTQNIRRQTATDVLLLAANWRPRALLRAQLLEDGFSVFAVDSWSDARDALHNGPTPRLVVVDLEGLPQARATLQELRELESPDRVLVLDSLAAVHSDDIAMWGFRSVKRPLRIKDIVDAVALAAR
jgi:DNA-binding response OmpR family regulator